jgi:hypothetical protein
MGNLVAEMSAQTFTVVLCAKPGTDATPALRGVLKIALRRYGLRCNSVVETRENRDVSSQMASAFSKLRHDVARRAARSRRHTRQTKGHLVMSDGHTLMQKQQELTVPAADDGWNDAAAEAAERTIRGTLLKFADWRWTAGKEATLVEDGTQLVALATAAMWVRWENDRPVEYIVRQPGKRLPDREDLGYDDQAKWEKGPDDKPKDPWQNTRLVYLVDPQTAEAYTFSTSSWGGRGAVIDLADSIARMRSAHLGACPIVELRAAKMPTKFGMKSKPILKIVGWKTTDADLEL